MACSSVAVGFLVAATAAPADEDKDALKCAVAASLSVDTSNVTGFAATSTLGAARCRRLLDYSWDSAFGASSDGVAANSAAAALTSASVVDAVSADTSAAVNTDTLSAIVSCAAGSSYDAGSGGCSSCEPGTFTKSGASMARYAAYSKAHAVEECLTRNPDKGKRFKDFEWDVRRGFILLPTSVVRTMDVRDAVAGRTEDAELFSRLGCDMAPLP